MDDIIDLPRSDLRRSDLNGTAARRAHLTVAPTPPTPRCFHLVRHVDVSGVSGTGIVAEGVEWSDGTVVLRWHSKYPTTTVWQDGLDALIAVHGHGGLTTIEWLDRTPQRRAP